MSDKIDISPEAVERLANLLNREFGNLTGGEKHECAEILRALSARLAEVEAERDEYRRLMRLERQISDRNAAHAERAEALSASARSAMVYATTELAQSAQDMNSMRAERALLKAIRAIAGEDRT